MAINLLSKKCVPCEGGVPALTEAEAVNFLEELSDTWKLEGNKIAADFKFKDFKEAMRFINNVAVLAEKEGHHPDITVNYSKVHLVLWTHAIGGLSDNDFILAAKIDEVFKSGEFELYPHT
ncbi:MAG: 4a-hydroxytetrahydrobiopterin dehydratase [Patescibacteria group bacterium]